MGYDHWGVSWGGWVRWMQQGLQRFVGSSVESQELDDMKSELAQLRVAKAGVNRSSRVETRKDWIFATKIIRGDRFFQLELKKK